MPKNIPIDAELAHAAGEDAANRRMRADGRTSWNQEDLAIATDVCNRLLRDVPIANGGLKGLSDEILARDYPSLLPGPK